MLERADAITNEVLELITFVLAYPTVLCWLRYWIKLDYTMEHLLQEIRLAMYVYRNMMATFA